MAVIQSRSFTYAKVYLLNPPLVALEASAVESTKDNIIPPTEACSGKFKRRNEVTKTLQDCMPMTSLAPTYAEIVMDQTAVYRVLFDGGRDVGMATPFLMQKSSLWALTHLVLP